MTGLAYLLKDRVGDREQLLCALTAVAEGGSVVDPVVVDGLVQRRARQPDTTPLSRLTKLDIPDEPSVHRRVEAVLAFLARPPTFGEGG